MITRYVWAAVITVGFILYGSLTPFHWYAGAAADPVLYLLSRWNTPGQSVTGFVANIALYMPLGLFVALARGPAAGHGRRLLFAGVLGTLLCIGVELIQVYDWGRQSTLTDVYLNVLGALIGAELACRLPARLQQPIGDLRQPFVLALLACFFVIELYPFIPTLNLGWYDDALASLWQHPRIHTPAFTAALVHWLLAAALLERLFGVRDGRVAWLGVVAGVFIGQIVILNIWLSISEWSAVLAAGVLWFGAASLTTATRLRLLLVIVLIGQALRLLAAGQAPDVMLWPFTDLAAHEPIDTLRHVLAWFYDVGGLVWLLAGCGKPPRRAGVWVAAALAGLALLAWLLAPGLPARCLLCWPA